MIPETLRVKVIAAALGLAWTVSAAFLTGPYWGRRVAESLWWLCLMGPAFGLVIYHLSRWSYHRRDSVRAAWAIISVYLATGLYGICLGILDRFHRFHNQVEVANSFLGPLLVIWGYITFIPTMWALFLLAFWHHSLLEKYTTPPP